jgi:hypothetical protein
MSEMRRVPVTFEPEAFESLNNVLVERIGANLAEIANRDPLFAYRAVRIGKLLYNDIFLKPGAQAFDGSSVEEVYAARTLLRHTIEDIMPDPVPERSEVVIFVWNDHDFDKGPLPEDYAREPQEILSFVVEPPAGFGGMLVANSGM